VRMMMKKRIKGAEVEKQRQDFGFGNEVFMRVVVRWA